MPSLNYAQTLDMVEAFMEASGIRAFCTNMCKGDCCGGCYETKDACHKHEGRRMSCSVYLCYFKAKISAEVDLMSPFKSAERIIHDQISEMYHEYRPGYIRSNSYLYPPPKQVFVEFEITQTPTPVYLNEGMCLTVVKAGLSLTYAAKIKVIMNKITRLAHEALAARDPGDPRKGVQLSMFDVKRKKVNKRYAWEIKHYND